jgi:hypothetical protein
VLWWDINVLEAAWPSKMLVAYHIAIWCNNPGHHDLNLHCCKNLKVSLQLLMMMMMMMKRWRRQQQQQQQQHNLTLPLLSLFFLFLMKI